MKGRQQTYCQIDLCSMLPMGLRTNDLTSYCPNMTSGIFFKDAIFSYSLKYITIEWVFLVVS